MAGADIATLPVVIKQPSRCARHSSGNKCNGIHYFNRASVIFIKYLTVASRS